VKRAAVVLGISRGRLYRLMEKLESVDLAELRQVQDCALRRFHALPCAGTQLGQWLGRPWVSS
jgi:hypothetical protein